MKLCLKRGILLLLVVFVSTFAASSALADEGSGPTESKADGGYRFGLAATIGEGMYFIHKDVYRGPVSPGSWIPLAGHGSNSTLAYLRRLRASKSQAQTSATGTSPSASRLATNSTHDSPLYLRVAVPLQIQRHDFDLGPIVWCRRRDIHIVWILGIVLEADTTLSNHLKWGGDGVPLEFRVGLSFHY